MSRPTIADVAREANVSKATVSRVLSNNYEYMREETREKVLAAIERLNFRPSSIARSLTSKRTNIAALLISDVGNPFYADAIHGVEDLAFENNYNIFLCNTNYDLERGMQFINLFIDKQVDGVIIMSSTMTTDWLEALASQNVPTVVLDWEGGENIGNLSMLRIDFEVGIQQAVDHLIELGHRRFTHISGPLDLRTSHFRRNAILKAIGNQGLSESAMVTIEGNLRIEGGRQALREIINSDETPTAIIAANDLTAIGVLSEARAHNISIPEDLSVIGLDNIWLASETDPPLTTIALPRYQIGQIAMQSLFDLMKNAQDTQDKPKYTTIETTLVIRDSTAAPASNKRHKKT